MADKTLSSLFWSKSSVRPEIAAALALLGLLVIARLTLRTYRIHGHPLKSFKGPPEACVSEDWLYKVTKDGTAEQKFEALHQKYSMNLTITLLNKMYCICYWKLY